LLIMRKRDLRRRCRKIIAGLDIPAPFDVDELCARIAEDRRRPIDLVPVVMPPRSPSGVWLSTKDRDVIAFERRTTPLHQEHIILHELGHMLNEDPCSSPGDAADVERLLPDLDPKLIERMLTRTAAYSAVDELVAETFATMVLEQVNRWTPKPEWEPPAGGAEVRRRIHLTFEPTSMRWKP